MTATRDAEADLLGRATGELLLSSCVISVCRGAPPALGSARCPTTRRGAHGSPYPAHCALCRRRAGLSAAAARLCHGWHVRMGAHTCVARCGPSAGRGREGQGRVARVALGVLISPRSRLAAGSAHMRRQVRTFSGLGLGRYGRVARAALACSSRRDRDSQLREHTCAARCGPSAGRGRGGKVASRERHGACSSRCDRDSRLGAHT